MFGKQEREAGSLYEVARKCHEKHEKLTHEPTFRKGHHAEGGSGKVFANQISDSLSSCASSSGRRARPLGELAEWSGDLARRSEAR